MILCGARDRVLTISPRLRFTGPSVPTRNTGGSRHLPLLSHSLRSRLPFSRLGYSQESVLGRSHISLSQPPASEGRLWAHRGQVWGLCPWSVHRGYRPSRFLKTCPKPSLPVYICGILSVNCLPPLLQISFKIERLIISLWCEGYFLVEGGLG